MSGRNIVTSCGRSPSFSDKNSQVDGMEIKQLLFFLRFFGGIVLKNFDRIYKM